MFAIAMTIAADCETPSAPEVAVTPAIITAVKINEIIGNSDDLAPSMRKHLENPSVAQSLDGLAV
jgi:hypothetical protein